MAFKKKPVEVVKGQKSTEQVQEVITPLYDDNGNEFTQPEDSISKEEQVKAVLKAQAEAKETIKSSSPAEYLDEPSVSKFKKSKVMVQIVALQKKYRDKPFMTCAPYSNEKRCYLTGQEDLTPEQLAQQAVIINPDNQYPLVHGTRYDVNKPSDKIMLNYFKNIEEFAQSKKDIKPGVSFFYLENREEEAEQEISTSRKVLEAMNKINECSLSRLQDIAMMLSLGGNNLTKLQAENLLWKECQKNPQRVLDQFLEGKEDELFLRRCLQAQILFERIGEGIYERLGEGQNMFLGRTIMEAVKFVREAKNTNYVARWGSKLKEKGLR